MPELSDAHQLMMAGRDDFASYIVAQYGWYSLVRHTRLLIRELEGLFRGDTKKLMVFCPPQHSKTVTCSELFPAWAEGKNPWWRTIVVSYGQDRADDFGERIRWLLQTSYHQGIFPECIISATTKSKNDFELEPVLGRPAGAIRAAGRGASITGLPADLIVLDDLEKDEAEAKSPAVQTELQSLMNTVIDARMHPETRLLMIKTRWDPADIAGWELENHPKGWRVVSLANLGRWVEDMTPEELAELTEDQRQQFRIADEQGTSLWPEKYPTEWVKENKRDRLLPSQWLALHQQIPNVMGETQIFDPKWLKVFPVADLANHDWLRQLRLYIVCDPANAKNKRSDYTVILLFGLARDRNIYIIDGVRDRLNQGERTDAVFELHKKWNPISRVRCVGWESYGLQTDIEYIKDKMKKRNYRFRIEPLGGNVTKANRIGGLVGLYHDQQMWWCDQIQTRTLKESRNLTEDFRKLEFDRYPAVSHDDTLDCNARIRDMLANNFASFPIPLMRSDSEFYRRRAALRRGTSWMSR